VLQLVNTSIDARIRRAITQKQLIEVGYNGRVRIAEPHDYGSHKGLDRLLIYQLRSQGELTRDSKGWRLLDVAKIESLRILDAQFQGSRGDVRQHHHTWDAVYERV
jgi:hypothetical protein